MTLIATSPSYILIDGQKIQWKNDLTGDIEERIKSINADLEFITGSGGIIKVNSSRITDLATPTSDYDAATKKYIDDYLHSNLSNLAWSVAGHTIDTDITSAYRILLDSENGYYDFGHYHQSVYKNLAPGAAVKFANLIHTTGLGNNTDHRGVGGLRSYVRDDPTVTDATKGVLFAGHFAVDPLIARNNVPNDDVNGVCISNEGSVIATDGLYFSHRDVITQSEWYSCITIDAWAELGISFTGTYTIGIDMLNSTCTNVIRFPDSTIQNTAATGDHGELSGLSDDDHTQYLLIDGSRKMTNHLYFDMVSAYPSIHYTPSVDNSIGFDVAGAAHYFAIAGATVLALSTTSINAYSKKIVNVVDPIYAQEAATKKYVDDNIGGVTQHNLLSNLTWSTAGHTIDTDLNLAGHALILDTGDSISAGTDVINFKINAVDRMLLGSAGLNMQSNKISILGAPTVNTDAATKGYVDGVIHPQSHTIVSHSDTTVTGAELNADHSKLGGIESGATADQSASEILTAIKTVDGAGSGLDADLLDGCNTGMSNGTIWKIVTSSFSHGAIFFDNTTNIDGLLASTDGYQLTTHTTGSDPTWAAASDLIFSEQYCEKCKRNFEIGDAISLLVVRINEVGDSCMIPIHTSCVHSKKQNVSIKRKVYDDTFVFDENTGLTKLVKIPRKHIVELTQHKLKMNVEIDAKTGDAWKTMGRRRLKQIDIIDASDMATFNTVEDVFENVNFYV